MSGIISPRKEIRGGKSPQSSMQSSVSVTKSNQRSCVTCRSRKVRCDKRSPCINCMKSGVQCIFPDPKRAPRKLNRPPVAQLRERMRQLEEEIETLRSSSHLIEGGMPHPEDVSYPTNLDSSRTTGSYRTLIPSSLPSNDQLGRLMVKGERSCYVDDKLLIGLGEKIQELRDVLSNSTSEDDPVSDAETNPGHLDFLMTGFFGNPSLSPSIPSRYSIPPAELRTLWQLYQENVAPLIPILHRPSVETMIQEACYDMNTLDSSSLALLFSVCFAAVVSMRPEQCWSMLRQDHTTAIQHYKHAVDHALAKANFIGSENTRVLQAAVLFLLCARSRDDTRCIWAMSAVVVRGAQRLGVHRDGCHFGQTPFETEMRRRLWWHICILDMLSSEDQGMDTQIQPGSFDTRFPSNIDAEDLTPDLTELPPEQTRYTDITLCILHCEMWTKLRGPRSQMSARDREDLVRTLDKNLQDRYLRYFNLDVPIEWVAATICRLVLSKAWLSVYLITSSGSHGDPVFLPGKEDHLFRAAVEIVEFAYCLQTNEQTVQWVWLFKSYKQWHVVAYILSELCIRPICPETDHAWDVANKMYNQWKQDPIPTRTLLWKPLTQLMERTASVRANPGRGEFSRSFQDHDLSQPNPPSEELPFTEGYGNLDLSSPDFPFSNIDWIFGALL